MNGIPSTEIVWTTIYVGNDVYFITSKRSRDCYYMYKLVNDKAQKLGKDEDPKELTEKYIKES